MSFAVGNRFGPYEITAKLGAGGMGEVYKARDTRLDRLVAIKVLASDLAATAEARERFAREAKVISRLSHPHICALYDVGRDGETAFLVMELLEGETLAARLAKGPLPLAQTVRYGIEIVDALDKAHRLGIVHRDLKPGNVMLTREGVKLLDFGLAKAVAADDLSETALAGQPTLDTPLTGEGAVLGTVQYMAPEQLEGKAVDARCDLFAFGATLYEMATGKRAFDGNSRAALISAVLRGEPMPISTWQPLVPPALEHLVKTCLAKDRDERVQSAHDVELQLQWIAEGGSQADAPAAVVSRRKGRERLAWVLAGASLLAAALLGLGYLRRAPTPAPLLRSSIELPPGMTLASIGLGDTALALSPDERQLVIAARSADGRRGLWLRSLDGGELRLLAETEGATSPFWSPDSRQIGFFAEHKLKKVPAAGGAVVSLADAPSARGASWSRDGVIVFAPDFRGGLRRVSAAGGEVSVVTVVPQDESHRLPWFLPDGRHLLFVASHWPSKLDAAIEVLDLETGKATPLLRERSEGRYVEPGYLLFVRDGNLMAQPFDAERLRTTGDPVAIAEKVQFSPDRFAADFSVSSNGLLIYEASSIVLRQLTWFDLDGKKLGSVGEPAPFIRVVVAPDARRVMGMLGEPNGTLRAWLYDLGRGVGTPFDAPRTVGQTFSWVWSPDGRALAVENEAGTSIVTRAADGTAPAKTLASGLFNVFPTSWSPDGQMVALSVLDAKGGSTDIWVASVGGDRPAHPYLATSANEGLAAFSPDGSLLAYVSTESGRTELYVAPYSAAGSAQGVRISSGGVTPSGGVRAAGYWLGSGRRIAYVDSRGSQLVAVDLDLRDGTLRVGAPHPLLGGQPLPAGEPFDVTRDGKRLLAAVSIEENTAPRVHLVSDWTHLLERQ
ncbi:MAG TPA: protein kinase [Thermoanaerobaculia bacterium]|jgi:Tol biopolymer transport system component|nr:protein kinase [Thermoanaerobaculia bacterium]